MFFRNSGYIFVWSSLVFWLRLNKVQFLGKYHAHYKWKRVKVVRSEGEKYLLLIKSAHSTTACGKTLLLHGAWQKNKELATEIKINCNLGLRAMQVTFI